MANNNLFQSNVSPERQAVHKQIGGRIIVENELKLTETLQENAILKKQLKKKVQEKERMQFKYAKTQSQFLEIMRELSRFRREFDECHSLRSKFLMTKTICSDISKLLSASQTILYHDS